MLTTCPLSIQLPLQKSFNAPPVPPTPQCYTNSSIPASFLGKSGVLRGFFKGMETKN